MKHLISTILIFLVALACAQQIPEIDLEEFAERRFQVQDEDINYEDLYESLLLFYTNPINLNKASREELGALYLLSPTQLNAFMEYRETVGTIISLYELQAIPEFDLATVRDILPFVSVDERVDTRPFMTRVLNEENNYLLLRYTRGLQEQAGYAREDGSGYLGDPNTLYGRFRVSHPDDFSMGVTFEKDAGEQLALNPSSEQYGFDYYSFHFLVENKGIFKTTALGDYQLQFGQGLVFGAGFGTGKGAETVNTVKRNSVGLKPYGSVLESGYFRGVASTLSVGGLDLTIFGSRLKQDANFKNDSTYSDFDEFVNSIQITGLHHTPNLLAAKNSVTEISSGFALDYHIGHRFSIGATGLYSNYSTPLQKKPNNYNQFEFTGKENVVGSVYSNFNWQNFMLFGELARSKSGGIGAVAGIMTSLTSQIDFSWLYRNYDKNFHSFYGNAFGESTRNINEHGSYWGLSYHPSRKYRFTAYFDKFTFPWLRFRVDAPSEGFEYLGRFTYKPSRTTQMYAQYRQENKQISGPATDPNISALLDTYKRNYIFNLDYAVGRTFSFKSRIQGSSYTVQNETTTGIALVQDVNVTFWKMKLSTRFSLFETEDFNNRQYIYEKDVLYAFSIPAYSGAGTRSYAVLQYNINQSMTIWLRYAQFQFADQTTVGSGLTEIDGNTRSEFKMMLRYKFRD
ncbi:MAG: helix-hairpin-helix domain-containing protein [Marinoscillum sp.]